MQICNEIINNPIFSDIKKEIPLKDIIQIKNWWVLESYKRYGFKNVFPFYKVSPIQDFILDKFSSHYSFLKYRIFKVTSKKYRKKYGV